MLQHLPCVHMLCCWNIVQAHCRILDIPSESLIFAGYILWESGASAGRWIYPQRDLVFAGHSVWESGASISC